ncbi:MFS transporter [Oceanobacillus senegalensis]|uniref:MFS transporter n=1 Tax=Oceanobacillus senegalensis TaxID=1936063 RepID=UPI000A31168B|nr:aromatic acid/H+ symport family MFS transporter [Oceanobacillus senegalensis]
MEKINVSKVIDESKFNSFHFILVCWGFFILLADGYDLMVYGSVIPSLIDEWSISSSTAGFIGSLTLIGSLIGNLIFSIFSDKFGRKITIITCVISFSFFTMLCGIAFGPVDFAIYRFIAGLALGGVMPIVIALISDYVPKTVRSMLIGVASTGFAVGGIFVALVGSSIITNIGWEWMFIFGGFPLLVVPFLIKYLPDSLSFYLKKNNYDRVHSILKKVNPSHVPTNDQVFEIDLPKKGVPAVELFKEKRGVSTLAFWVSTFMLLLMVYGLGTWLPQIMVEAGYPLQSSLMFLLALNFGAMFGQVGGGLLADRIGSKKILIGMFLLGAISLTLFGFQFEAVLLYILVGIAGACTTGGQAVNNAYASKFYPGFAKSTGVGWALGMGRFGAIVGPAMGGLLLDLNVPIIINFIMFAIPGILAAIAITFVQDRYSEFKMESSNELKVGVTKYSNG